MGGLGRKLKTAIDLVLCKGRQFAFLGLCLSFALASDFALADPAAPNCNAQTDEFKKQYLGQDDPDETCQTNAGAQHDKPESATQYKSICYGIFVKIRETIEQYRSKKTKDCLEIQRLVREATSCSENAAGTQKDCPSLAATNYSTAARVARGMAADLEKAEGEVAELYNESHRASEKYKEDRAKIEAADQKMEGEIMNAMMGGQEYRASELSANWEQGRGIQNGVYVQPEAEVGASNGSATSIKNYKNNMDRLLSEQEGARQQAGSFTQAARTQMGSDNSLATELERMAAVSQSNVDRGGRVDSTVTGAQTAAAPVANTGASKKMAEAGSPKSQVSEPGSQTAGAPPTGGAPTGGAPTGGAPPTPPAGSSPYSPAAFQHSSIPLVDSGENRSSGSRIGNGNGKKETANLKINDVAPGATTAGNAPALNLPGVQAGASPGPGRRGSSAASRRPASSRGNGTSASTSSAGGAFAGFGSKTSSDEQALSSFRQDDLSAGGLGIAGSEVNAAMDALSEEFGGFNFGVEEGALTDEEKAAFSSLEGRSAAASGSAGFQGEDPSLAGLDSEPLFERTRAAHFRALQRGQLIRMVRTRL